MVVLTAGPSRRSQPEASVSSIGHGQEQVAAYSCDFYEDIIRMLQLGLFNLLDLDLVRLDIVYSFHSGVVMLKTKKMRKEIKRSTWESQGLYNALLYTRCMMACISSSQTGNGSRLVDTRSAFDIAGDRCLFGPWLEGVGCLQRGCDHDNDRE